MLRFIIRNLVSNAIKFTPVGKKITLTAYKNFGSIKVEIIDTGVGMSEEDLKKLFRIDVQFTTRGTMNEKGTGLGLIICKDFVEKNGGKIKVESTEGKGSCFSFTIPKG